MNKFLDLFEKEKPVIGMLHLDERDNMSFLDLAKFELDTYMENGVDGVIVENYFGNYEEVQIVLEYLYGQRKDVIYGVNFLGNYVNAFDFANYYEAKFIQIDSVSGHLVPEEDEVYGNRLNELREETGIPVIGGVRFKYQPYLSGRTLEEDLSIGMTRSDGIVVTGLGTGIETDINKIKEFKAVLGDFPLIIGAGVTIDNCTESLEVGDAAIVGSYFKNTYQDKGIVSSGHVKRLMNKVNTIRK